MTKANRSATPLGRGFSRLVGLLFLAMGVFFIVVGTVIIPMKTGWQCLWFFLYFYGFGSLCIAGSLQVIEANGEGHEEEPKP